MHANRICAGLLVGAASMLLAACSGGEDGGGQPVAGPPAAPPAAAPPPRTIAQQLTDLETSGALPKLDRSAGIAGPDTNANGIRDDIDGWIAAQPFTSPEAGAARQMASSLQKGLAVDLANREAVRAVALEQTRAVGCMFERFPDGGSRTPEQVIEDLQALTANTRQRLQAHLAYSKAMNGVVTSQPGENSCA